MAKPSFKSSKIKVPKRVAGVKIPKAMRKGPVMEFVNSSAGRLLIAEALTVAIGAFAYKHTDSETLKRAGRKVKDGAAETREAVARKTARLSLAFSEAVTAFRTALAEPGGANEGMAADASEQPRVADERDRGKKNKKVDWSSSEPEPGNPH
jgi:hypothetical protein